LSTAPSAPGGSGGGAPQFPAGGHGQQPPVGRGVDGDLHHPTPGCRPQAEHVQVGEQLAALGGGHHLAVDLTRRLVRPGRIQGR
jgi:hypothetical protein